MTNENPDPATPADVTRLLGDWRGGSESARERLFPLVYDELRRLAARQMAHERPDHTLQATALVHEAYLRLTGRPDADWESRAHFFAFSARIMRNILVDHARGRRSAKRGGKNAKVPLDEALVVAAEQPEGLVALDDALEKLAALDPRKARIIELRFFGGLSVEEVAAVLGLSTPTIVNETRAARAWLHAELSPEPGPTPSGE